MKPEWKEFLEKYGAEISDGKATSFGNSIRENQVSMTGKVICDLSQLGLISISGEDAESFLQNQTSNDITKVNSGHSQLSSICNPKGRMLALFHIFKIDNVYYLSLPREMTESVMNRLRMYILLAKVNMEDISDHFVRIGFSGPEADQELKKTLGKDIPVEFNESTPFKSGNVIRLPGNLPRFEINLALDDAQALWEQLNVHAAPVGSDHWRLFDILAGIPQIYPDTQEAFIPQMANLDAVDGVSFTKGCYPGQEIVARTQYLGKLKKRLYIGSVDTDQQPQPGDNLYTPGNKGQSIGQIVDAQAHPDGGFYLSAIVQSTSREKEDVHLNDEHGPSVKFHEMPYSFPEPVKNKQKA